MNGMRAAFLAALLVASACGGTGSGGLASPTPGASLSATAPLPSAELKYRLVDELGRPAFCDPDFYPVARADEAELAKARFPEIERDAETLRAILAHERIALPAIFPQTYPPQAQLAIYQQWKMLNAIRIEANGAFAVRVFPKGQPADAKSVTLVEGTIDPFGRITVAKRGASGPLMCPICLADTTRIATPSGDVPVTSLRVGDSVWTVGANGARVAAPLVAVGSVAVERHEIVEVALVDGRVVRASPGHPTADGRAIGALRLGDALDGGVVRAVARLPYAGRTYDLLPASTSGAYWADGVLLGSTLRQLEANAAK